jgi:hypothetical protein
MLAAVPALHVGHLQVDNVRKNHHVVKITVVFTALDAAQHCSSRRGCTLLSLISSLLLPNVRGVTWKD